MGKNADLVLINNTGRSVVSEKMLSNVHTIESVTAHTIFHHIKFPVIKAFYMLFLVNYNREITVEKLSTILTLREKTCWAFRKKILDSIGKSKRKRDLKDKEGWGYLMIEE